MEKQTDSMILKKLWDVLYCNKGKIELIAAIITIISIVGGLALRMHNYRNSVSVTETVDTLYESDTVVLDDRSYQIREPEQDHIDRIIFDIVNNNDKPLYFNNDGAVTVEVLAFMPYHLHIIMSDDIYSFRYPWIDPIIWRATIKGDLSEYYQEHPRSKPLKFAARPITNPDIVFDGKEYLEVDSEELTRFIVEINPFEWGQYIIKINIKYKYGFKNITYESKKYYCTFGFGKVSIIEYNP